VPAELRTGDETFDGLIALCAEASQRPGTVQRLLEADEARALDERA
jgi:hypothetical protein